MRRLGHASTRAALIYQHADRESERAIAAGLSETIQAALVESHGHVAGTEASEPTAEGEDDTGETL
jgi:hypothetical protein